MIKLTKIDRWTHWSYRFFKYSGHFGFFMHGNCWKLKFEKQILRNRSVLWLRFWRFFIAIDLKNKGA